VEKVQVTFGVRGLRLDDGLYQPLVIAGVASNGDVRRALLLQHRFGEWWLSQSSEWFAGHMEPGSADRVSAVFGDAVYNSLLVQYGCQLSLLDDPRT